MKYIDLNLPDLPGPRAMAWLKANGIDPSDVPAAQYVQVTDSHLIYQAFKRGPDGHKLPILDSNGDACAWEKQMMSAPLLSAPEDHNL